LDLFLRRQEIQDKIKFRRGEKDARPKAKWIWYQKGWIDFEAERKVRLEAISHVADEGGHLAKSK
jgi:predicted CoA-binding protein